MEKEYEILNSCRGNASKRVYIKNLSLISLIVYKNIEKVSTKRSTKKFKPWSSPIHIVRKDGGNIRITQDFKKLMFN